MRAPLIDGILKILSVGDDFEQCTSYKQVIQHGCGAHLDACPSQSALSAR